MSKIFILILSFFVFLGASAQAEKKAMFSVIYRGFIKPKSEKKYRESWRTIATYFVKECGAVGSALHQTSEGEWIAYSRWPDRETRDKFWVNQENLPKDIKQAIARLKECSDDDKPRSEICLDVKEDLIFNGPSSGGKSDLTRMTQDVVHQMDLSTKMGTKKWDYKIAVADLPVQVGSLTKLMMQRHGDRYAHGLSEAELKAKIADELADILSLVLFISHELSIDIKEAWALMLKSDHQKISSRQPQG